MIICMSNYGYPHVIICVNIIRIINMYPMSIIQAFEGFVGTNVKEASKENNWLVST